MSVNTIDYAGPQPTASAAMTADTKRGPTDFLWAPVPTAPGGFVADFIQDPSLGMHFFDDFLCTGNNNPLGYGLNQTAAFGGIGNWAANIPLGAGVSDNAQVGGVLAILPGTTAIASTNQITSLLYSAVGAFQISKASSAISGLQGKLIFEARIALTSISNGKRDAFVGLIDNTVIINSTGGSANAAASTNLIPFVTAGSSTNNLAGTSASNNLIGFYFPSASYASSTSYGSACPTGDCSFIFQLASTAPVFCKNLGGLISNVTGSAIAANTFYKLGFVYDPAAPVLPISVVSDGQTLGNTAKGMLKVYVNGIQAAAFQTQVQNILTASFPTGVMGPILALAPSTATSLATATSQAGVLLVDWVRVGQIAVT